MTNTPIKFDPGSAPDPTLSFQRTARLRRSYRGFLDTPVAEQLMREVLTDAQCAPSNCNTQPWDVHIVSGARLTELSRALQAKNDAGEYTPDFSFDMQEYTGRHLERQKAQGKAYYDALGVKRDDPQARHRAASKNYEFFNAPHVALLFMPSFGDNVRVAGDIGMYGQTFLLSLAARGLGGIPQTSIGFFAQTIREFLGIGADRKMLFAISFGYPDDNAPANTMWMDRVAVADSVTFHA